jgi:hypothetical protein
MTKRGLADMKGAMRFQLSAVSHDLFCKDTSNKEPISFDGYTVKLLKADS